MIGNLFIVAAPSGAGKTTLVGELLKRDALIRLSISYTTRPPRPGEADGRDYHFIGADEFEAMRAQDAFLECAEVHGNHYGTSRRWLQGQLAAGCDVLLEIDWQGARQVRRVFPQAIGVFILPPSYEELERRLRGRAQDGREVIDRRLRNAREEMQHVAEFEYVIINNNLQEALADLTAVVHAARLRYAEQRQRHASLFSNLHLE